jgi:hypothetical protein
MRSTFASIADATVVTGANSANANTARNKVPILPQRPGIHLPQHN